MFPATFVLLFAAVISGKLQHTEKGYLGHNLYNYSVMRVNSLKTKNKNSKKIVFIKILKKYKNTKKIVFYKN